MNLHLIRRRNGIPAIIGLSVLVLAACAPAAPASSGPSAGTSEAAVATTTPEPSPTPLPGLPDELIGRWQTDLTQYLDHNPLCPNCGAETELTIHAHGRYTIGGYGPFRPSGSFTFADGLLTFDRSTVAGQGDCPNATYSWLLEGDELTFSVVGHDGCAIRADALDGVTYTRAE